MKFMMLVVLLVSVGQAQTASSLHTEFLRRDGVKLGLYEGGVINYLRMLQFPVTAIVQLKVDDQQNFTLVDSSRRECKGSVSAQTFECEDPQWSLDQEAVLQFLNRLSYPTDHISEIEIMNSQNQDFLIKDAENMICLGSIKTEMLRCKNIIGITGVLYSGDSD